MKLIIAALAVAGCAAWGQQACTKFQGGYSWDEKYYGNLEACQKDAAPPKPLKCGKYQHVEWQIRAKVIGIPGGDPYEHVPGSEYCADDMHSVTEKEWQELMARLKALERSK